MSNFQLTLVAVAVLLAHIVALIVAVARRRTWPAASLNVAVAGPTLAVLIQDLRWLRGPVDLQMAALAVVEILILVTSVLALRTTQRAAAIGSWTGFTAHLLASGVAVVFVFTFKITRLF